jgi:hypothetical protein
MIDDPSHAAVSPSGLRARIDTLRRENALLEQRVARLQRQLASTAPLIEHVRRLAFWDFTPYEISLDDTWVAVDRSKAAALMAALAHIDHWNPWGSTIEPRPQP